jgi:hypothetical protein
MGMLGGCNGQEKTDIIYIMLGNYEEMPTLCLTTSSATTFGRWPGGSVARLALLMSEPLRMIAEIDASA